MPGRSPGVFYNFHRLEYMRMRTYYMINSLFNQPVSQFTLRSFRERTIFHSPMHTGFPQTIRKSTLYSLCFFGWFPGISFYFWAVSILLQVAPSMKEASMILDTGFSGGLTTSSNNSRDISRRFCWTVVIWG